MATVADAWRPTSELEHRLQETVRAGDQESYFRLLADSELVVPVPPEAVDGVLSGEARPSWPTQEEDGRVHVLVYTSASAMRACMGPSYQHFMTVRFGDIAETWPDSRWWLAIDAPAHGVRTVLPIEARMPSWFVRQVAEGDGRPPQVGRVSAPWEELRDQHRDLPREAPRTEFQPANDVERDLLRAASTNDHDLFLQTLADTEVLLPVPDDLDFSLRPGRPGFPWQTREVDGSTVVPVFTSPERLTEAARAAGTGTEFITLPFTVVLRYWPNHDWLLAINSGSPAGGTVLAQQLPGLATWADQRAAQRMADRFEPQNDVEQRLLDAARRRDTDGFFKILLGAQVLVPTDADTPWGIVPGDAEFPWRPVPVHGRTSIQLFTSLKWMNDAIGSSRFIMPSLLEMVTAWPDTNWTLVLNPGTPIDASMPGDQVRTLRGPATPPSASTPPPPEAPAVPVAPAVPSTDPAQADEPAPAVPGGTGRHSGPSSDPQDLAAAPTSEAPSGAHAAPRPPAQPEAPSEGGTGPSALPPQPAPRDQEDAPGQPPAPQNAPQEPQPSEPFASAPNVPPQVAPAGQADALGQHHSPQDVPPPVTPSAPEETPGLDPAAHGTPPGAAPANEPTPSGIGASAPNVPPRVAPGAQGDTPGQQPPGPPNVPQGPQPSTPFASGAGAPQPPAPASEPSGSGMEAPNVPPPPTPSGPEEAPGVVPANEPIPTGSDISAPNVPPPVAPGGQADASGSGLEAPNVPPPPTPSGREEALAHPAEPTVPDAGGEQAPGATPEAGGPRHAEAADVPQGRALRAVEEPEPAFEPGNRIDQELFDAAQSGDSDAFLRVLLNANVLVPIPGDAPLEITPMQQEFRWDAALRSATAVQVFTSLVRLREVLPESRFVYADFRELIGAWPREDWTMLLNPGTRIGASLRGDQVRALSEWAIRVGLVPARPEVPVPPPRPEPAPQPASDLDDRLSSPTIMQKVVPHGHVAWYLEQGYDRVGGFVHSTGDVAELQTPAQLYEALGLLCEGSPFSPGDEGVYVIRWPAYCPDLYRVPFGGRDAEEMAAWGEAGWVIERPPFLGSGFAPGSAGSIREYKVVSVRLPYGAEMYYLGRDRSERFIAMYDPDRLAWLRPDASAEAWNERTEATQ
ncbi:SseB family protein [Actinomadura sp. B10D3]|uniref:SseB family protein n=1 Tax=Actinomadura sp. B10D3 TaxID=3153557 RepID=UPI00325E11DE